MENLTLQELETQYRETVSDYRYYVNTDDYNNWIRETESRNAAKLKLGQLVTEFERRGLTPPKVP